MSRRFYVYHHRKARDLQRACEHHARVMRAIADADEAGAVRASDEVLDYVEAFTRATLAEGR
jgi:DNA-binding GntR family transcriptional regulator